MAKLYQFLELKYINRYRILTYIYLVLSKLLFILIASLVVILYSVCL
ncbi:hypothetical protein RO31_0493 [Francisella tularensis subsp. tularensis str. SCHU S4 substr. NR-28534]|nr:hypothetical protein RO31_0493 [Francisella tularensis subsp. tularensis str. SCHU S4 substr. NR-28534]